MSGSPEDNNILQWKAVIVGPKTTPYEVKFKEVNKEQPSYRNLSATATRVLQCTCPVAASRKYFSAIHTSPQLTSHLTMLTL